jgi:hypothetical protein
MDLLLDKRKIGFYKIVDAEKQLVNGNSTGMIWLTEISRVLVPEEMYSEQLSQEY